MALCFGCRSHAAEITHSTPAWCDGKLVIWRLAVCPPPPLGCGERRRQIISDDGPLVGRRYLPATAVTRPSGITARLARKAASGGAVGSSGTDHIDCDECGRGEVT